MKLLRPIVAAAGGVGQRVADAARLQEVVRILVRHGLGALVTRLDLPGMPKIERFESTPERASAALQELGPTAVKLGQVLSTRPDLLPVAYCAAFEQLQDDVGPIPRDEIELTLVEQLGPEWRSRLDTFDELPLATASVAQVHRARLADGRLVVLKIQRRGIAAKIRADLNILHVIARAATYEFPEARSFDPQGILLEFERSITSELDFKQEAESTRQFRKNFAGDPRCRIPFVVDELSTDAVLCLEYLDGTPIRRAREAGFDMKVVGERYLSVAYDMLYIHGLFHGDMHPGNVLVMGEAADPVLGILDFGMIGRLTREQRGHVLTILIAAQHRDHRTLARIFYEIAIKEKRIDWAAIERDTLLILERHLSSDDMEDIEIGGFITDLTAAANRHGARVPLSYTMFFKALLTSEGLARTLLQEQNPIAAATPYFERMLTERFSEQALQQEAMYQAIALSPLARRLPVALTQLLDDFDAERLQLRIREVADPERLASDERRTNRQILAAFALGSWLCGTLALDVERLQPWGLPVLSLGFWTLGTALAAWVLLGILRHGDR